MYDVISSYIDASISYHHLCYRGYENPFPKPHIHDAFEFIFLKKGNVTYSINEKTYELGDNSLIITRPHKLHSIKLNNPDVYDRYVMIFDEYMIWPDIYKRLPENLDVLTFKAPQNFISIFEKTDFYCKHFEGESLKNILFNTIEEIFYNIVAVSEHYPESIFYNKYTVNPVLAKAIEYIEKNITKKITLDFLCGDLYISKSYLNKIFAENFNISPKKYINQYKLAFIQKELQSNAKPMEIYQKYGFSDYSAFYREYKNFFGHPPSKETGRKST